MFDFVRNNTRLMLGLLVLLIVPSFVLFGIEGYKGFNSEENARVASVDGQKITKGEWDAAHRQQSENIRRQVPNLDPALLDKPEAKYESLEQLVRQRVLALAAQKQHLSVSDAQLQRELMSIPQLAALRRPDGRIDVEGYKALLSAQGYTPETFEAGVRQDLLIRQVLGGIGETGTASTAAVKSALQAVFQERQIRFERFTAEQHLAKVAPSDADLEAYYKRNESSFRTTEQADIEYLVLDAQALGQGAAVAEDELRQYYEQNLSAYTRAEERRASHILITVQPGASAEDKAKARTRIEALLAEVRKAPARFAEVAKAQSQDPGSAAQGGDLDFIARGAMVKPFEDAVYSMKVGEIVGPVETDFGLHIIQLNAVRGGERQPFEKVRAEIEGKLRQQVAQKRYAESAEAFSNLVYEQADSLQPAAERFKLPMLKATVGRAPAAGAQGPLASAKLLSAIFGDEALKNKRNTDAVETGASQLVSARVVQHRPSVVRPLAEVKVEVMERVRLEQALERARQAGQERLKAAQAAPGQLDGQTAMTVSRGLPMGLPRDLMDAVLKADASKLPAVIGVDVGRNGYAVVRIDKVSAPELPAEARAQWTPRLTQAWSAAESRLYYEALKQRLGVEMKVAKPAAKTADDAAAGGTAAGGASGR